MNAEQEAFEAWAISEGLPIDKYTSPPNEYLKKITREASKAWHAAQASRVPMTAERAHAIWTALFIETPVRFIDLVRAVEKHYGIGVKK